MQRKAISRKQHEALRVPSGWSEQDRALVIQLERILDNLYSKFGRIRLIDLSNELQALIAQYGDDIGALQETAVTNVGFNETTRQLTKTINGSTTNVVSVATLDSNGKIPASQLPSYVDDVLEYASYSNFPVAGETDKIYVALDTGFTYRWSGSQYVRLNTYDPATQSESGLMSATDKRKLDGVAEGATANEGTITGVKMNGNVVGTSGVVDLGAVVQNDSGKADKVSGATNNNFAALDANGNLKDSGHKHSDYLTQHQNISGKADKVSGATNNNFAALDASGNLKDSGHKHSDYLTQHQDISGKADKSSTVSNVTYNSTGKKITKTINGSTTDVVTVVTLKADMAPFTWGELAGQ